MRVGFCSTQTSVNTLGNSSRKTEPFLTRPLYSHRARMPHQMLLPPPSDNRRRQSFYLWIVCGLAGCERHQGRRQGRRRSSALTLCYYIAAVVLLQNTMMMYSITRRANNGVVDTAHETTTNWMLKQSTTVTATSHVLRNSQIQRGEQAALARLGATADVKSSTSQRSRFGELDLETATETERMYYRKRTIKVNTYNHQPLLVPTQLCDASTLMVILVHSGTNNIAQRAAIRETWGEAASTGRWPNEQQNGSCAGLRLAFVLGLNMDEAVNRAVREEHARYNDIVQGDFIDHYHNMTLKSLLDLKVVDERCPGVRYLLKTDDDMIVNLPYLLLLLTNKKLQWSIMGPVNVGARVHRSGKWKLTHEEFPFVFYPPYESGSAYVITGDLIHELFVTSEFVPHIFVDDVYVTGVLGRILGVNHVMHRGFASWHSRPPSVCDILLNRVVAGTKMTPNLLVNTWKQLYTTTCPVSICITRLFSLSFVYEVVTYNFFNSAAYMRSFNIKLHIFLSYHLCIFRDSKSSSSADETANVNFLRRLRTHYKIQ